MRPREAAVAPAVLYQEQGMPARSRQSSPARGRRKADRTQCHFVSNTHWDREWKYSAQRIRQQLVEMMDMLLDIFATQPEYRHFHLDSQTAPLLDYLELRPERETELRRLVASGKLAVGPWFTLPDEFCVSGESLIRNLLLGHRIARRFGRVSKSGYSPFSWGQVSQMPQIYAGFGIDLAMFYRGVNTLVAPRSEFIWQGADGTRMLASRLAARPRYNAWYVLQRPAYWGVRLDRLNDFALPWSSGHGLFRLADEAHATLDYQLAHPRHAYDPAVIPAATAQALREQDGDWTTPHRLWSAGHDSSCPDPREMRLIADSAAALRGQADVFHSSMQAFAAGVRAKAPANLPVVKGEMRHTFTQGSTSALLGWIISARGYLKQENFRTERALTTYAEPLAVFAAMLGAEFPRTALQLAYRYLLENHAHDSIGGCGRDVVHDDMQYRWRQTREISTCITERALRNICGAIDLGAWDDSDLAVVVYNPTPQPRAETVALTLDTPPDWPVAALDLRDETGKRVPLQYVETVANHEEMAHIPNDVFNVVTTHRHRVRAGVPAIPGMGYRTFRLRPNRRPAAPPPRGLLRGKRTLENKHVRVSVNANGTFDLEHRQTRRKYRGLGYFQDSAAAGNPWQHQPPPHDRTLTTRSCRARVEVLRDGPLESALRVIVPWRIPASLTADRQRRSRTLVDFPIANTLILRRDQPWIEVITELDNRARDHYLRVSFPARIKTRTIHVQGQFDVVARDITLPDPRRLDEPPQPEQPMNSFVDLSDGRAGLALLNEGLKAYEAHDDADQTVSLTLLRALAMRFFVPERGDHPGQADGAQCPGRHVFRYAVMPHAGDWHRGGVWPAAEAFANPMLAAQITRTPHGHQPLTRSFLEVSPHGLHVSAVKPSEDDTGWVVRVFNPTNRTVRAKLRFNGGRANTPDPRTPTQRVADAHVLPRPNRRRWRKIQQVTLEEIPVARLAAKADGWCDIKLRPKQIATYRFT
jgi:mannosylglycerate hydrolase